MIIEYNRQRLEQILLDFYNLTKLSVCICDDNFNQLAFQPSDNMPLFCRIIKNTKYGHDMCFNSDISILKECTIKKGPVTHMCHAGLCDTAIPICDNGIILGYLIFGQIKYRNYGNVYDAVNKFASKTKMNKTYLLKEYDNVPVIDHDFIESACNILTACTKYILLSEMIKIKDDGLPSKIETYINRHLEEKLSVTDICLFFNISKNKLYNIFKNNFSTTFGKYLLEKRIKLAKNYLANYNMTINEICSKIGVNDYNYFIKIFKKSTGLTPLAYRKTLPMITT